MHAPSQILIPLSKKTINFPTQGTMQLRFSITVARRPNHLKQPSAK